MSVPAIALYSSPHHSYQIGSSHSSLDFELSARASAATASPSPPPSSVAAQKVGGLSRMFSSASASAAPAAVRASPSSSFASGEDHGSFRQDRRDDFGSSFSYSPHLPAPFKRREESPVSVFRGPVSCSSGSGSSKSPPLTRSPREWIGGDWRTGRDKLFKGFVRCALNSCLDHCSSSSFSMPAAAAATDDLLVEELPFALEEEETCEPFAKEMLAEAQARHKVFHEEVVVEAFYEAEKAHRGQMRASGDPYLHHCLETAILLARIGAHATVVAAGLLHDTLDDSFIDYDHIFRKFGAGVADLVEGVSKLSHLSQLARDNNTASKTIEADRLHTMFLAMADVRAVLIKLADRLHNMMTLEALPAEKQQRFAKETLEIFVPLACRLGISSWKEKLENLCFKYLYPEEQKNLSLLHLKSFNEALVASAVHGLGKALVDQGINYHALSGRDKSLYSIYSKMLKKNINMEQIHDIHGIRLIVENEEDCYKALDVVHRVWPKLLGRFKDYIRHPKFNGYQSLHTVVLSEDMLPLEVQIRTKEMHQQAEYGIAAHWKYKEGDCKHSSFVLQMVEWARWVLSWQCEMMNSDYSESFEDRNLTRPACSFPTHSDDCPNSYAQSCAHSGPIFVVMLEHENMSVLEFPTESTVMDLMERVSGGGSRLAPCDFPVKLELRPKLNRELVSDPNQKLKMGDVVELTPALPGKSLTEYRQDFQRMYEQGLALSSTGGQKKKPTAIS